MLIKWRLGDFGGSGSGVHEIFSLQRTGEIATYVVAISVSLIPIREVETVIETVQNTITVSEMKKQKRNNRIVRGVNRIEQ